MRKFLMEQTKKQRGRKTERKDEGGILKILNSK